MSRKNTRLTLKKMTTLTVFLAVSLCISLAESFFPPLVPIPGVRLGLANVVTLLLLYDFTPGETLLVLLMRILLSAFCAGQAMSFVQSVRWHIMLSYHVVSVPFSVRQVSGAYQYLRCPRPQCRTAYGCLPVYRRVQCACLCACACRKRYSDRLFYRSLRLFYPQISVPVYKEALLTVLHQTFVDISENAVAQMCHILHTLRHASGNPFLADGVKSTLIGTHTVLLRFVIQTENLL